MMYSVMYSIKIKMSEHEGAWKKSEKIDASNRVDEEGTDYCQFWSS